MRDGDDAPKSKTLDASLDSLSRNRRFAHYKNALICSVVFIGVLLLDQWSKAQLALEPVGREVAGSFAGLFRIFIVHNTGGAWGILGGFSIVLAVVSLIVCSGLFIYAVVALPKFSPGISLAIGLICAGGVGNMIDRFTQGYVLDFIDLTFMKFPVFNIADIAITVGVGVLLLIFLIDLIRQNSRRKDQAAPEER